MVTYLASREPVDFFLGPGDFLFGDGRTRLRTLLGSCVAITVWHPQLRHGGMCHYLLPERGGSPDGRDGRYADGALAMFLREMAARGTQPGDYETKLFGGGWMFAPRSGGGNGRATDIGCGNIEAGRRLLRRNGFRIVAEHLAGGGHRHLVFDIASGDVWVRHATDAAAGGGAAQRGGGEHG